MIRLWDPSNPADRPAVEREAPLQADPSCTRCPAHEGSPLVCMRPERVKARVTGQPTLLVVAPSPERVDFEAGAHLAGIRGRWIRDAVASRWRGTVIMDYAVRCAVAKGAPNRTWVDMCRGYLARTVQASKPDRVLCLGSVAAAGILGRSVDAYSARRAWAYLPATNSFVYVIPPVYEWFGSGILKRQLERTLDWALLEATPAPPPHSAYVRRWEPRLDAEFQAWLSDAEFIFYDCETYGRASDDDFKIITLTMARHDSDAVWGWCAEDLTPGSEAAEAIIEALMYRTTDPRKIAALKAIGQLGGYISTAAHNRKFDDRAVRRHLRIPDPPGLRACTMMDHRVLNGDAYVGLEIVQDTVGMGGSKDEVQPYLEAGAKRIREEGRAEAKASSDPEAHLKRSHKYQEPMAYAHADVPRDLELAYCARDSLSGAHIRARSSSQLAARPDLERTMGELVMPLITALGRMEEAGIRVVRDHARSLQRYFGKRVYDLSLELKREADINWKSGKQLAAYLYEKTWTDEEGVVHKGLGLTPPWRTKTGAPSTEKAALLKLTSEAPIIGKLIAFRGVEKLRVTYAWGLERHIQDDGRIHTNFKTHGAETGRLSSHLHTIPAGQDDDATHAADGKSIKRLFLPTDDDHVLVQADFSQLEVRVAAMLSGDPDMQAVLASGVDFHLATARLIAGFFNEDPALITKGHWLRKTAKVDNFALLYGKGDASIAEELGIALAVAAKVRAAILGKFKRLAAWIKENEAEVRKTGGVWIYRFGDVPSRYRPLPHVASARGDESGNALRAATNSKVQGAGSEYCLASVIGIDMVLENIPLNEWQRSAKDGAWDHVDAARRRYHRELRGRAKQVLTVHDSIMGDVRREVVEPWAAMMRDVMCGFPSKNVELPVDITWGENWADMEELELKP